MITLSLLPDQALSRLTRKMSFSLSDMCPLFEVIDNRFIFPHIPLFVLPFEIPLPEKKFASPLLVPGQLVYSAGKVTFPMKTSLEKFQSELKKILPQSVVQISPELMIGALTEGSISPAFLESKFSSFTEKLLLSPCLSSSIALCEIDEHGYAKRIISSTPLLLPDDKSNPPQSMNFMPSRQ